jgi:hypothetical protein
MRSIHYQVDHDDEINNFEVSQTLDYNHYIIVIRWANFALSVESGLSEPGGSGFNP